MNVYIFKDNSQGRTEMGLGAWGGGGGGGGRGVCACVQLTPALTQNSFSWGNLHKFGTFPYSSFQQVHFTIRECV